VTTLHHLVSILALLGLGPLAAHAAGSAPDGARLYADNCSACHGTDGHGGVGVPLALPSFLSSVDDLYLTKTIRLGRPGRVMSAFTRLSDAEVDAIVAHLRHWPNQKPPKVQSREPIRGDVTRGSQLFATHCTACHGEHGEGGHGTGVTMSRPRSAPILAPALNNPGFLAAASDTLIKDTLMQGREGTPMVSFLKQGLTEKDVNDVVAYVRHFQSSPRAAAKRPPDREPPVLVRDSPYSLDETIEKVKMAIGGANMRLIRIQTLDQGYVPEGQENHDQTIVYSCDFGFLNEALKVDPRVGLFLPCRVTVVKQGEKVRVMSVNPKQLSRVFNNTELDQLCDRMYQVYTEILEESVL
jgi:cytochrome c oxidase cbb3-type subunit 3